MRMAKVPQFRIVSGFASQLVLDFMQEYSARIRDAIGFHLALRR